MAHQMPLTGARFYVKSLSLFAEFVLVEAIVGAANLGGLSVA
jgi:hypothetical protein